MSEFKLEAKGMGCTDTGAPEVPTWVLRNIHEVMKFIEHYDGEEAKKAFWKGLPGDLKMEYNYANWNYVPSNK